MPPSRTTKDPDEIRKWAEARGAVPAEVTRAESGGEPSILHFKFPSAPRRKDAELREISWEDFFTKFRQNNIELVYQDKTAAGRRSNFNKLIHPDNAKRAGGSRNRSAA